MHKNSVSNIVHQKYMFSMEMPVFDKPLCYTTGVDPEDFFPTPRRFTAANRAAKELCNYCPMQTNCLNFALENDIWFGIWGGTTAMERGKILGKRVRGYNGNYRTQDR